MCDCQEPKAASAAAPAYKPIDLTKPVQTRDGRPVEILRLNRVHPSYPVVALVTQPDGRQDTATYTAQGDTYTAQGDTYINSASPHPNDLVNVPPKVVSEAYLNIYSTGVVGAKFTTKAAAQREASPGAIGIIKLTTFDDGSFTVEKVEV